jgi:hypothetical protein
MTLCPIALVATCNKCPAVNVCPLKSVLGDHKPDDQKGEASSEGSKDKSTH